VTGFVRHRLAGIVNSQLFVIADDHQLRVRGAGREPECDKRAERAVPRLPHFPLRPLLWKPMLQRFPPRGKQPEAAMLALRIEEQADAEPQSRQLRDRRQ
jgi:hypothetical protein